MNKASELINSDEFRKLVIEASKDPDGDAAKKGMY